MDAPIYLKKYTKEIDNLPGFKYQNWFSNLSWKGQLSIDDCSLFSVYFEGVLCEDGSIASTDKSPLRVYAKRQGYNEKIVLFDEELYGYTPLLIEKVEYFQKSKIKKYKREGHLFEVFIWANSSIDFEDEFHFDENNKITLLNGNSVDIQFLKSNAFDAFGIILRNEEKRYINLLEMELS